MMRPLYEIARDIRKHWPTVSPYAKPYVEAMREMTTVEKGFYHDTGYEIVARFLSNAATWRGEDARRIKAELRSMIGLK